MIRTAKKLAVAATVATAPAGLACNDTNTATFTNQKISGSACGISATANFSGST